MKDIDKKYFPTEEYKYFYYDGEGDGFVYFKCKNLRDEMAQDAINAYLHDGWEEEVTNVICGEVTHKATMTNKRFPEGDIDDEGVDEAGDWWDEDWDYKCKYEAKPLGYICPSTIEVHI